MADQLKLKLDLHVHTERSPDAFTKIGQLAQLCKKAGIDGLAITDHDMIVVELPDGIPVIPGIEVSSKDGHVIALGVSAGIPRGLPAGDTIREIQRLGGLAVIPHPYDLWRSSVKPDLLNVRPDAVEVVNSSSLLHSVVWKRAREFARKEGLPVVAGSDSHIPQTLGMAFTEVQTDSQDVKSIVEAIRSGFAVPKGRPITAGHRIRKLVLQATKKR